MMIVNCVILVHYLGIDDSKCTTQLLGIKKKLIVTWSSLISWHPVSLLLLFMMLYCVFNFGAVSGNTFFHKPKFFTVLPAKRVISMKAQMDLAYSGSKGFTGSEPPRA